MSTAPYDVPESIPDLDRRITAAASRSATTRLTAVKLYLLFQQAGEDNPIAFAARAVGAKPESVRRWLEICADQGVDALLAFGRVPSERKGPKRKSERRLKRPAGKISKTSRAPGKPKIKPSSDVAQSPIEGGASTSDAKAVDADRQIRDTSDAAVASDAPVAPDTPVAPHASAPHVGVDTDDRDEERFASTDFGDSFSSALRSSSEGKPGSPELIQSDRSLPLTDADGASRVVSDPAAGVGKDDSSLPHHESRVGGVARRVRARMGESRRAIARLNFKLGRASAAVQDTEAPSENSPRSGHVADTAGSSAGSSGAEGLAQVNENVSKAQPRRGHDLPRAYRPDRKYVAPSGDTLRAARVLIAEPDSLISDIMRHRLEKQGADVITASDGMEVVSRFWSTELDLVVVAVALPGLDGFEITRWLRGNESNTHVPILVTSWPGNESDLIRAFDAGADDFMRKPFSPTELVARSKRLLQRTRIPVPDKTTSAKRTALQADSGDE